MAYRILIQLFFFMLPFLVFGVYRLLVADAEADGRKAWPVHILFGLGAALSAGVWLFFILRENKARDVCYEPARFENGVLIDGRQIPCDQDVTRVGLPGERHGEEAQGVDADDQTPAAPQPEPAAADPENE